jgi:mercuric ion transport protein
MAEENNNPTYALGGAIVAAATASLCCILPLVAAVLGFTGFAASRVFENLRPYLLAVTFGLLAAGFYLAYRRPREACEAGSGCERRPIGRWNRAVFWLVTSFVVGLAAFPYSGGWIARGIMKSKGAPEVEARNSPAHAVLKVDGMDCSACAVLIEKKLSPIPGVFHAEVSFEKKQAVIDYDPRAVDPSQFVKAIAEAGYRAVGTPPASK